MKELLIKHPAHAEWPDGLFELPEGYEKQGNIEISIDAELLFDFLRVLRATRCKAAIQEEIEQRISTGYIKKENGLALLHRFLHVYDALRDAYDQDTVFSLRGPVKYV